MPQPEQFEVLVLGSGVGGTSLALGAITAQDRRGGATPDWWLLSQHRLHAEQE